MMMIITMKFDRDLKLATFINKQGRLSYYSAGYNQKKSNEDARRP